MKTSLLYILKIWQSAVLLAPALIVLYSLLRGMPPGEALFILLPGIVLGLVFSIPSAVLFAFAAFFVANINIALIWKKIILSLTGIALTMLAFVIYDRGQIQDTQEYHYFIVYAAVIVAGVWSYKLDPMKKSDSDAVVNLSPR